MINTFPVSVRIKKIVHETPLVNSYFFDYDHRALPGQFVTVWLPGVDEKPMSIAHDDGKTYQIAVAAIGTLTKALATKKVGDFIGVRGPFGTHFSWKKGQHIAMLPGGYGAAPLYFAAERAVKDGCTVDFFHGARSAEHLVLEKTISALKGVSYLPATDDGTAGHKGTNVEAWQAKIKSGTHYDSVMTCGPELMMKAISDTAWERKIPAQISVERYMKCGFGICGNCCVDDLGITTCMRGTVMANETVRQIKEFGVYHRDSVGRKQFY